VALGEIETSRKAELPEALLRKRGRPTNSDALNKRIKIVSSDEEVDENYE
jgi:hypothetical protein